MGISTISSVGAATVASYGGGERVAAHDGDGVEVTDSYRAQGAAKSSSHTDDSSENAIIDDAHLAKIMEEPVKQANKALAGFDRMIEREVHAITKTMMYKIKDTRTNEVIAEYPPKKIQDMIAKMWELAGLFIDQKA